MKRLLGAVAILAAAMPLAANAADLPPAPAPYKAPVVAPVPAYNWTGFYVGASLGGEWEKIDGNFTLGPGNWSVENSRGMWDAHVGAQYQWGMVVFGVEGNFVGLFNGNNGATSGCGTGCAVGALMSSRLVDDIWTIGGRLGWAFGPWMPYLSGGYANTRVDNLFFNTAGFLVESTRTQHDGAYIGGGFDWQVWSTPGGALVAGVEYRHYEFQGVTATPTLVGGGLNNFDTWTIKPHVDTIEGRLSWLFNWGGPVVARY
jgi:outer membrane immunogenic protein